MCSIINPSKYTLDNIHDTAIDISSDDNTNPGSCFDTENDDSDPDTNPTDTDTDVEPDDVDVSWLIEQDNVHPPEYYFNQENVFDKAKFDSEVYGIILSCSLMT